MTTIIGRASIIIALSFAVVAASAVGTPDAAVTATPVADAGPAGSVIWD